MAKNVAARQKTHNGGKGSKYVRSRGGGVVVYQEKFRTKSKALKREAEVKKWTRLKKQLLIKAGKKLKQSDFSRSPC